jgi:hypothetical protein
MTAHNLPVMVNLFVKDPTAEKRGGSIRVKLVPYGRYDRQNM